MPIELRNKLQEFVTENRIYRKNVCILADAKEIDGGVELKITVRATVIAAKCEHYYQSLEAEEPLEARIICASLRSPTKSFYQVKNITMKTNHEPMVVEWKGSEKTLSTDDELISYIQYSVRGKPKDFYVIFFGTSVIGATVRVTASDGLEIFASKPDLKNGNEYVYKKVFLRGDHIQIRWRPKPSISTGVIAGEGPGTRESG